MVSKSRVSSRSAPRSAFFDVDELGSIEVAVLLNSDLGDSPFGGAGTAEATKEAYHQAWTKIAYDGDDGNDIFSISVDWSVPEPVLQLEHNSVVVLSQWLSTLESLTINGLGGNDRFEMDELPDSVKIILNGDDGDDTWQAAPNSGNLEFVNDVTFNGGNDNDSAVINDANHFYAYAGTDAYSVSQRPSASHWRYGVRTDERQRLPLRSRKSHVDHGRCCRSGYRGSASPRRLCSTPAAATMSSRPAPRAKTWPRSTALVVNGGDGVDSLTIDDEQNPYPNADSGQYRVFRRDCPTRSRR